MIATGIYAGSFDPITKGHLDLIKRAQPLCNKLIIAVGANSNKKSLFSAVKRIDLISSCLRLNQNLDISNISVTSFDGLLVDFARKNNANVLIRGIRSVSDFEYEMTLSLANKLLDPNIETVFLFADPKFTVFSSSMVKEIASHGGNLSEFVEPIVDKALEEHFGYKHVLC